MMIRTPASDASDWTNRAARLLGDGTVALWTDPDTEPVGIVRDVLPDGRVRVATHGDQAWLRAGGAINLSVSLLQTSGATGRGEAWQAGSWHVASATHDAAVATDAPIRVTVNIGRPGAGLNLL